MPVLWQTIFRLHNSLAKSNAWKFVGSQLFHDLNTETETNLHDSTCKSFCGEKQRTFGNSEKTMRMNGASGIWINQEAVIVIIKVMTYCSTLYSPIHILVLTTLYDFKYPRDILRESLWGHGSYPWPNGQSESCTNMYPPKSWTVSDRRSSLMTDHKFHEYYIQNILAEIQCTSHNSMLALMMNAGQNSI